MIRFENVTKTYKGSTVALRDITVEIEKGEFVFLVGASGSGKTTFIRLLLREELPDAGQILEAGRNIVELPKWRVPYLRRFKVEREIYDAQITSTTVGKHVAPHATGHCEVKKHSD